MIVQGSLIKAIEALSKWFGLLRSEQHDRGELEHRAIKSLYTALNETLLYLRRIANPHLARTHKERQRFSRDIEAEERLSRLWFDASVELRELDGDLARKCMLKGQFWANRDSWTQQEIERANISLSKLLKEAEDLLK